MSMLIRSALVAIALVGSVPVASASDYRYDYDHGYRRDDGHRYGYWAKSHRYDYDHGYRRDRGHHGYWRKSRDGKWHHYNTLKFFDQLRRNGN